MPGGTVGGGEAEALAHRAANASVGKHLSRRDPASLELLPETGAECRAIALAGTRGTFFQGPTPVGKGFILEREEAQAVLDDWSIPYSDVVQLHLTGEDLADDPRQRPGRWIIDFGQRELDKEGRFPRALAMFRNGSTRARLQLGWELSTRLVTSWPSPVCHAGSA
ncbi:MAG: hypothetical protein LH624_04125 [Cryobacterium sp.]|nr:hypothetical protein [Cryobacterium sp.]